MRSKKGSITATILVVTILILFGITGKLDKNQADKEAETLEKNQIAYIPLKSTYLSAPVKATTQENQQTLPVPELLQPCGLSIDELQSKIGELAPYAEWFLQAEVRTGINAKLLISIAALESGWGTSDVFKQTNNMFGWTDESGEYMAFDYVSTGISYVAQSIKEKYLSPGGENFNGYSIPEIAIKYNTVNTKAWADVVTENYNYLGG